MNPGSPAPGRVADELIAAAKLRPHAPPDAADAPRVLVVDVARQRLIVRERGGFAAEYPISTAAAGVGGAEGSHRTPPGWHRIHRKIGAGEPSGRVFESREPLDRVWQGEADAHDLILTRILTLEGLEPGVNQGPGVDSLERYVYVHGTNHEAALGRPASHGCVRMANRDVIELFDRVAEGDYLVVASASPAIPDPRGAGRFHYAGLGGSGMSALAQFQAMIGGKASGSDRAFDHGERPEERAKLERLGIAIHLQDGSGVGPDCAALVVSTAVEDTVPDVAAAKRLGIPIVHRSELLAFYVHVFRTIAVTGTSGKSSVVAMVFEVLKAAGRHPSVITGGDLVSLQARGLIGNAWHGSSDLLVIEADESDGSVVRYHPAVGVVLNLQKDHKAVEVVAQMFETFGAQIRETLVLGDEANLDFLARPAVPAAGDGDGPPVSRGLLRFGFEPRADLRAVDVELVADGSRFEVDGVAFRLAVPGRHNVLNALAAIAACRAVGVPLADMVAPLAAFGGVGRRFQTLGIANGVEVVDDFAHNPAKLAASIDTAQRRARRVLAVYQPHGYGPTRFLRADFVHTFATSLRPEDRLWLLEVFYAGGTAIRDFSAADIVAEIADQGVRAEFAESRERLVERIAAEARPGDLVLVMGARDPSLTTLARRILESLGPGGAVSLTGDDHARG
jgi:UDP-N-acetylmuramate-alanine ligase/lipoprotein-anchoring transpeptidase ErfK/SrfK